MMSKQNWREAASGVIAPIVIVALWQASAMLGWVNPQVLPSPAAVVRKWFEYLLPLTVYDPAAGSWLGWALSGELLGDTLGSMYRVVVGFAVGAGLALPLGLLMGSSKRMYAWFNPLMQLLRPIPPIAYIPLSILWFGLGNAPAIFLIALGAFFPVLVNTIAGVRIGIGTAFIVVIVSEMIAVNNGLGFRILEAREYFWSDKIIAGMISIGMLGLIIDVGMNKLNNHLLRWHRGLEN